MNTTKGTPRDFVYAGRKGNARAGTREVVIPLADDGTLGTPMQFEKLKTRLVVGGVYTGAAFDENTAYGIGHATYKGRWPDRDAVMGWEATTRLTDQSLAIRRLERSERFGEIETVMLPLRTMYANAAKRYDTATMDALRFAVVAVLTTAPRKEEVK